MFSRPAALERSVEDKQRRAEEARRLLDEPLLVEAFAALRGQALEALLACEATDDLGRFRLAETLKLLTQIERHLRLVLETPRVQQAAAQAARMLQRG
jgi:hypothetical protein